MSDRYSCPMCNGEGKVSVLTYREDSWAPYRILAYGAAILAVLLGGAVFYNATTPRTPTQLELCSQSCGQTRFKTWTEATAAWTEKKPPTEPDISHPPVPAKCECAEAR